MHKLQWARLCRVATLSCVPALITACAGQTDDQDALAQRADDLQGEGSHAAALTSGGSCDALLVRLQQDLLEQVDARAEELRRGNTIYYGGGVFIDDALPADADSAPSLAPVSPGVANDAGALLAPAGNFSQTTLQVEGVDEGDIVKADGDDLYLLHGRTLYVLDAVPAVETRIAGSLEIEGAPTELLVHDGKVVVFSYVYGDLQTPDNPSYYYYYYPTYTKLTVIDVTGETPDVVRESYVEGDFGSSRRHDGVVRALVRHGVKAQLDYPSIAYVNPFGDPYSQAQVDLQVDLWVQLVTDAILHSSLEDYLPSRFERVGGTLQQQPLACNDYWLPAPGLTGAGASSVISLDLDDLAGPLHSATVVGYADRLYANDDVVLITQYDYRYYGFRQDSEELPSQQTFIHRFDLDGAEARYRATGRVDGYIQSQFSLDESDGVVRVSTTEERYVRRPLEDGVTILTSDGPISRVLTLGAQGKQLVELGRTPDFGATEQIYATRFIGDRGYVVTFRQVDPLFVLDLSDARAPRIAGELKIPGFSNFLYPLAEHHLLSIGQDADERGVAQGLALQIFDVRDAAAPSLAHKYVILGEGYSEASYDHRAISFHPEQDLVAFPYQSYTTGARSLEVFRVSPDDGISRVGGVPASDEPRSYEECLIIMGYPTDPAFLEQLEQDPAWRESILRECTYYDQESFRRGLFRADDLYAITTERVAAYELDQLDAPPVAEVELPDAYYGGGIIVPPSAGFAGSGFGGGGGSADDPASEPPTAGGAGGAPADG
jgi:uncharacterized secreted protein with C-terminal beta-propeller domain